jgi:hypothetical protein
MLETVMRIQFWGASAFLNMWMGEMGAASVGYLVVPHPDFAIDLH